MSLSPRARNLALLVLSALAGLAGCGHGEPPVQGAFEDVTVALGLPAPAPDWPDGTYQTPEIMQGGVGLLDHDGDGDLDLFHVRIPPPGGPAKRISNRLYRQEEDGRFADVTEAAGLVMEGFGQGLAVGDVHNDGHPDVYVANYGPDAFLRNAGDGTFVDATEAAGLVNGGWSTAAAFCDYDGDGFLDLYVVRYLRYDPGKRCTDPSDRPDYCGPRSFYGVPDLLYRNDGDGTFENRSEAAGIVLPSRSSRAMGLGIAWTDFTGDGLPDVFVANDAQSNQLWVNRGDGTFAEEGILRGVALDPYGHTEASMGVALGDVDGDGSLDLFTTHLWEENNRLYLGGQGMLFRDGTLQSGLSKHDLQRTGFGCALLDYDHDGDVDLAVVNGAVRRRPPLPGAPAGMWGDYAEPNQLYENAGQGVFDLVDEVAGPFVAAVEVSRGLAMGDLDGDGDLDLVVSNIDNSLRVYRNHAPAPGSHWLAVRVLSHGRDALGAQVVLRAGGRELRAGAVAATSYCSSNDPRAHFGLGAITAIDEIQVEWTDGTRELFPGPGVDRVVTLRRGEGRAP